MSRSFDALRNADESRKDTGRSPIARPTAASPPKKDAGVRPVAKPVTGTPPARPAASPAPARPESGGALVPVQSPGVGGGFRRRFAGWLERFAGGAEKRGEGPSQADAELRRRIDELEKKLGPSPCRKSSRKRSARSRSES
jgi:hypothetical protein